MTFFAGLTVLYRPSQAKRTERDLYHSLVRAGFTNDGLRLAFDMLYFTDKFVNFRDMGVFYEVT